MWPSILKFGGGAFKFIKDNRTVQAVLLIGAVMFMDWRADQREQARIQEQASLELQISQLEAEVVLNRKVIEAKDITATIIQRQDNSERDTSRTAEDIIDEIQDSSPQEDAELPSVSLRANDRINCLLDPTGPCPGSGDQDSDAGDPRSLSDLP